MDKGVRAPHNVRTLRDLESEQVTASWNWLYGFPGEDPAEYADALRQVPRIIHLAPPNSSSRILLERFSPYFDRPELGFVSRSPAEAYQYVYDLPSGELTDLVYLFDTDELGIDHELVDRLQAAIAVWTRGYRDSSLDRTLDEAGVRIRDRRVGWPARDVDITDPLLVSAYLHLEHGRSVPRLLALLESERPGFDRAARDGLDRGDRRGRADLAGGRPLRDARHLDRAGEGGSVMTVQRGEHEEEITVRLTQPLLAAMMPSEFRERGCRPVRLAHPVSFGSRRRVRCRLSSGSSERR